MVLPYDEINGLVRERVTSDTIKTQTKEETEDTILELLVMAYVLGFGKKTNTEKANASINKEIAGKTWRERVEEYIDTQDIESIYRVADTEVHRVYNNATYDRAKDDGKSKKTWYTMLDDKVRETHDYLEGMQVGIDDYFYTWDDDYAMSPGEFINAENNVNCRCFLEYS